MTTPEPKKLLPHGDLEALVPGCWMVTGSLPIPLKRNMTVVRLGDGSLLLHSVIAMDEARLGALEALGKPSVIVVPSRSHRMDAPFYKQRYPSARVVCPAAARAAVEKVIPADATCEETLPPLGVRVHALPGMRSAELAYEVELGGGGRALLFCDLLANRDHPKGLGGFLTANVTGGVKGRLGVARIVKWTLIKDRSAIRAALNGLAGLPDLALLTVAHGRPLREQIPEALREAAGYLG